MPRVRPNVEDYPSGSTLDTYSKRISPYITLADITAAIVSQFTLTRQ